MPTTDLLKAFGLSRNPFTDRTAEKTSHEGSSLYVHSDLAGFTPSDTTYVFFGKRGSGKTTIRLRMLDAYASANAAAVASSQSRGHFLADLCRPGHLTACLTRFAEAIGAGTDNWDAAFQESWTSSDMVDCILSYTATALVEALLTPGGGNGSAAMLDALRADPRASAQLLVLAHLYARADSYSLAWLRSVLLRPCFTPGQVAAGVGVSAVLLTAGVAAVREPAVAEALMTPLERLAEAVPPLANRPRIVAAALGSAALAATLLWRRSRVTASMGRAAALQAAIRVVKPQPTAVVAGLLDALYSPQDNADSLRLLVLGVSAHQKLEALQRLLLSLGYDSLAVFGDCFDEVTLLDPVRYPGSIKVFAREVCRNDLLNFGRLHFFFPDSRLALDLSTDRTLKEARFDRHFVRDLVWSRHQLEELAERRFRAAQNALRAEAAASGGGAEPDLGEAGRMSFADLFKKVRGEDFSSYLAQLSTPRELLIMMTEMFARIEAHPEGGLTAQDMEIAVTKALEQAV